MRDGIRAALLARAFLTILSLLPYSPLLSFGVIYVTDDFFASDIFNGELPARVLVGGLLRQGELPVWTPQLCSGLPLAGAPLDPLGSAAFAFLPTAAALDLFVIVLLLIAAHGSYSLARRFGASRAGAVLAGLAFAGSGYIACQLKHLAIVSTVVWLPIGLLLIDRVFNAAADRTALSGARDRQRAFARTARLMATLGLVFAQQVLSGFPQSAYICALVYGAFALFCAAARWRRTRAASTSIVQLGGLAIAMTLGAAAGAVVLLPLAELGSLSHRAGSGGWEWSTALAYWPRNAWTFLIPYVNGDVSDNTYTGPPFFWEDYGYVGLATFLLAMYGAVRERRRPAVVFAIATTVFAYLLVLGPATPVYRVFYALVPGISQFRFPTRFLIVVELGLALLAAIGLTRVGLDLQRRRAPKLLASAVVLSLCAATAADLFVHQPRQNPMVPAVHWLEAPSTVAVVHGDTANPRTFTPRHHDLHRRAFDRARGWVDVTPYFDLRNVLQPNIGGGFWDTPSADCYAGVAPRWYVNVWGDHDFSGAPMMRLASVDFEASSVALDPVLPRLLAGYGVTHVLTPYPQTGANLASVRTGGSTFVYRVEGAARARFVRDATVVRTDEDAMARLLDSRFDPDREIVLHDAPETPSDADEAPPPAPGSAVVAITHESARQVVIDADASSDGFLLLADTFYPGWTAHVDGKRTPIYRANISVRGIALPRGRHEVRFTFEAPAFVRGLRISVFAISVLLLCLAGAFYVEWRSRRYRQNPAAPQPPITA